MIMPLYEQKYRIWSFEHDMWWKPNRRGYTQNIGKAGIYSAEEARAICDDANAYGKINEEMRPV